MKRFIVSILCVTVFSIGLGAIVESARAGLKSDEKALSLIRQARLALGGDQSINEVRSMIIKGNTTVTLKIDGTTRNEQGETEIAMQLPDKLSKMVKIGRHNGGDANRVIEETHDVVIMHGGEGHPAIAGDGKKKIVLSKIEGGNGDIEKIVTEGKEGEFTTSDGKKVIVRKMEKGDAEEAKIAGAPGEKPRRVMIDELRGSDHHGAVRQNELLRTTLSLLLSAPEGMDVVYRYGGESDLDGQTVNLVNADFAGSTVKLYLSKASNLPVMVSYQGHAPRIMMFKSKAPEGVDPGKDHVMFNHKIEAPAMSEFQVRFSDYRSVNGVQLPFKWTTSTAGQVSEVFDVTAYDINPANIAEKFQNQKVFVRTKKDGI